MTEKERVINQSIAALDQFWAGIEQIYPIMCLLSAGIPEKLTKEEREILKNCCKLIAWELSIRNLQKNRTVKCIVKLFGDKNSFVEINTINGPVVYEVDTSQIITDVDQTTIDASAYKMENGQFIVFLPTEQVVMPVYVDKQEIVESIV